MKREEVYEDVRTASNDAGDAFSILIHHRGEFDMEQEYIDSIYNLLGTAKVNIEVAMNKLRKRTTYHKEDE